jgi:hypothetical protein
MNSIPIVKSISLVFEDEDEEKTRKSAYLTNIKVTYVGLVDDPAVPKAKYQVVKMDNISKNEVEVEEFESTENEVEEVVEDSKELVASAREEIQALIAQNKELHDKIDALTGNIGTVNDRLGEQEGIIALLSERLPEETQVESQPDVDGVEIVDIAESSKEDAVEVIDEDTFESLTVLADSMFESYENGEITEEEFESFNSELQEQLTVLREVA